MQKQGLKFHPNVLKRKRKNRVTEIKKRTRDIYLMDSRSGHEYFMENRTLRSVPLPVGWQIASYASVLNQQNLYLVTLYGTRRSRLI